MSEHRGTDGAQDRPFAFPGTEDIDSAAALGGEGYTTPEPTSHPWAITAVVLGVLAILPGLGIAAVLSGHIALSRMARPEELRGGRGLATTGLVLGYSLTGLWFLFARATWIQRGGRRSPPASPGDVHAATSSRRAGVAGSERMRR